MQKIDITQLRQRVSNRLAKVYPPQLGQELVDDIAALVEKYADKIESAPGRWSQKDALLISYGDSVMGEQSPLATLEHLLGSRVGELVSYVHLLPFFPYSSDDGFAVENFRRVRQDLGSWDDIEKLSRSYRLVFDGVINHVSASSVYIKGYLAGDPNYKDFFIALDRDTDTSSVLRTRNLPLLHDYASADGKKWLWTTFSRDQVDLNFANPRVLIEILDVILGYAERGAAMIRLDAIPYLWKQLGTSCAHLPQTHELIKLMRDVLDATAPHVMLLTETNVPHNENISYFGDRGDEAQMIYNFSLAPLILWSLHAGDASELTGWAGQIEWISPRATYLNITATHDGIGMRPTEGILSESQRAQLVKLAYDHGGDVTGKRNSDGTISPYELNLSYFDAVNDPSRDDEDKEMQIRRFMVSQAILMSLMGIPGIYIHSLLGSRNDYEGVKASGRARSINRQQLNLAALEAELDDPNSRRAKVFGQMKNLLAIRASQSALHPDADQEIVNFGTGVFAVRRHKRQSGETLLAIHSVIATEQIIKTPTTGTDLITGEPITGASVKMSPYQIRWIIEG